MGLKPSIFPLNVFNNTTEVLGFIGGWNRRVSVMIDGAIGLAKSTDGGHTFHRIADGPILGPNVNEPFLVADPFASRFNAQFHMWYIFGERWTHCDKFHQPERIYKIAHATSLDAIEWKREGDFIISEVFENEECQALPTVIKINERYHMYFCFRYATDFRNSDRGYRLGHAYSDNLSDWTRDDNMLNLHKSLIDNDWDSGMLCYPHAFHYSNRIYMLYNGNEFGKYGFGLAELIQ